MPETPSTPRERLERRVAGVLDDLGCDPGSVTTIARDAVDSFYRTDFHHPHATLVAQQALMLMSEEFPPLADRLRPALDEVTNSLASTMAANRQLALYRRMAEQQKLVESVEDLLPRYDASGLPINEGPGRLPVTLDPPVGNGTWPCVECGNPAGLGNSHCTDCRETVRIEPYSGPHRPGPILQVSADDGRTWYDFSESVTFVDFGSDESLASRREYPEDRITGAPHHYIVNGDHDACGCGGHLVECEIHDDPHWRHSPQICGIARTLCECAPRHHYGQRCPNYAPQEPDPTEGTGHAHP